MPRSKLNFQPLIDYLNSLDVVETSLSIAEIEAMVGTLPKSAKTYHQWWENVALAANRPQRAAMLKTPYDTALRTILQRVVFYRRTRGNIR